MAHFEKIVHSISKVFDFVARWALMGMMVYMVISIFFRMIRMPLLGSYDFVGYLTLIVGGFSLAYCAVEKGHVFIGVFLDRCSKRTQILVDTMTGVLSASFIALTTWQLYSYSGAIRKSGELSPTTHIPFYPILYALTVCFLLLCLVLIIDLIHSIRGIKEVEK